MFSFNLLSDDEYATISAPACISPDVPDGLTPTPKQCDLRWELNTDVPVPLTASKPLDVILPKFTVESVFTFWLLLAKYPHWVAEITFEPIFSNWEPSASVRPEISVIFDAAIPPAKCTLSIEPST